MKNLSFFWHLLGADRFFQTPASQPSEAASTRTMLTGLQQLCAALPQGQAEVWMQNGQVNVCLSWKPEVQKQHPASGGIYFLLNGQSQEVRVAEYPVERPVAESLEKPQDSPLQTDTLKDEKVEKPSRQLKTLQKLLGHLQLHYAFRYNRLTDRTECACLSDEGHALSYQPVDSRVLNSLSLHAMQAGIDCWDRDVKRYVESAGIPSYHPFISYMNNLPKWDGQDRVTPLAKRISHTELWVNSFHRWMLSMTAQWMDASSLKHRANSVAPLLVSTRQGMGKSTFCRRLLPETLQAYFTESFDLTNPSAAENKLASFGLINIDEFDRLPASRMPLLKNLMQMESLNIRRAYKHSGEPLPRIASFIATSNCRELLTDLTGSRRFICVEVNNPIDCETPIDYDQLYAQLREELENGARTWFTKQEEAEIQQHNQTFYRVTPAEELLAGTFQLTEAGAEGAHILSASEIYTALKRKNPAALQDCTPLAFSRLMAQLGKRVHTRYGNGYWVKAQINS